MKKFENAELVAMDLTATAFGPNDPNSVDAEKYAVLDDQGNVLGYKEQYGEASGNN